MNIRKKTWMMAGLLCLGACNSGPSEPDEQASASLEATTPASDGKSAPKLPRYEDPTFECVSELDRLNLCGAIEGEEAMMQLELEYCRSEKLSDKEITELAYCFKQWHCDQGPPDCVKFGESPAGCQNDDDCFRSRTCQDGFCAPGHDGCFRAKYAVSSGPGKAPVGAECGAPGDCASNVCVSLAGEQGAEGAFPKVCAQPGTCLTPTSDEENCPQGLACAPAIPTDSGEVRWVCLRHDLRYCV